MNKLRVDVAMKQAANLDPFQADFEGMKDLVSGQQDVWWHVKTAERIF